MAHRKDKYVDHKLVRYKPIDALRDAASFVARFFTFTNFKHALRSVIGGFREFAVFFFAVFLVQMLYWCPMLAMETRCEALKSEAYAAADYHLLIDGLSADEWTDYYNKTFIISDTFRPEDRAYKSYEYSTYKNGSGITCYEVKLTMNGDSPVEVDRFLREYPISGEKVHIEYSPRTQYQSAVIQTRAVFIPLIVLLGVLSVVILLILYRIRINHYKFRYGIYMSFGAGFEKLFQTAAWELFAIAILTFVPALIVSIGIGSLIYGNLFFSPISLLRVFVWLFCVILSAVFPSVKFLATRTPSSLIIAGDNSNYVSSPRRSFKIFRKSFPIHYELFGFWRFRRYYATLLVSAIVFSSFFLCGSFINSMVTASENTPSPDFTLSTISAEGVDIDLLDEISELEGVSFVSWENSIDATAISAYVVLDSRQRAGISSKTIKTADGYADNNFKYSRIDEMLYSQVTREGVWKIEGDLSRIMNEENCIAVSEYINNTESLNFKVGDTVRLAVCKSMGDVNYDVPDNKHILSQLLVKGSYEFITVEIAAIVDTGDTDDRYMIAMSDSLFEQVVAKYVTADHADVYVSPDLSYDAIDSLYTAIRSKISSFDDTVLTNNRNAVNYKTAHKSSASPAVVLCAIFVLLISPPVWFFSQSMFGAKRKTENEMLSAFGATDSDLGKLYLFSGASLSVPAIAVTAMLGWGITQLIYAFVNRFLTSLGMGADFRYSYEFSFIGLLICIVISVLSAIASTYVPFLKWKKERDRIAQRHLGE
ncbi:MAG: FtsX-like permease family protein [Eubacteriales bacterium]